jgi:hypothetical protein
MPIFPIDGQSLELGAADVGAEFFLQRVPPPGWIGGDGTAGAVLTSSELVAAVIDRVRAYPTGLEFWVTFHPTTEFAEPLVLALKTARWMPDNLRSIRSTGDVPGPTVDVVTSDGNVIRPEIARIGKCTVRGRRNRSGAGGAEAVRDRASQSPTSEFRDLFLDAGPPFGSAPRREATMAGGGPSGRLGGNRP